MHSRTYRITQVALPFLIAVGLLLALRAGAARPKPKTPEQLRENYITRLQQFGNPILTHGAL